MKKSILLSVTTLSVVLLFSCGKNMEKLKEAREGISNMTNVVSAGKEVMEDMNNLSDKTPLNHEEFKRWIPGESFQGMKRTNLELGGDLSEASVTMSYADEKKHKKLDIMIIDGADPIGSMIVTQANMFLNTNINKATETASGQVVDKKGVRALEHIESNNTVIETVVNKRYYVKVAGSGIDNETVWKAFKALKTDKLTK